MKENQAICTPNPMKANAKNRLVYVDIMKGFLTLAFILAHALDIFGNRSGIKILINQTMNHFAFSAFVFCQGIPMALSPLSKPFPQRCSSGLKNMLKLYGAYCVSALMCVMLLKGESLDRNNITQVLLLNSLQPYSEFILTFAVFILMGIVLAKPILWLVGHTRLFWMGIILLLSCSFFPVIHSANSFLGMTVGINGICFPAFLYFPFFLVGVYFSLRQIKADLRIFLGTFFITALTYCYSPQMTPGIDLLSRWPPRFLFLIRPIFPIYLIYIISLFLEKNWERGRLFMIPLISMGKNSLFCLVVSNITYFALKASDSFLNASSATCLFLILLNIAFCLTLLSLTRK